jgi:hypothetical protein
MVLLSEHIYQYKTGRPDVKIKVRENVRTPIQEELD